MKEKIYKVFLEGTVREGFERPHVVRKLAGLFKKDEATIERLLSGNPRPISKGLDRQKAYKYLELIERTGAACRVDAEEEPPPVVEPDEPQQASEEPKPLAPIRVCPRCGYEASSDEDIMVVRGDCPKCGLLVQTARVADSDSDDWGDEITRGKGFYQDRTPAAFDRRFLAGLQTFSLFWAVYLGIVYIMIFIVFPAGWITGQTGLRFLKTAFLLFPELTSLISIGVVSLLIPLLNEGRSVGQSLFAIEPLFSEEAQTSGLALSVTFRAAAIAAISFLPGRAVLWICGWFGLIKTELGALIVIVVCACLSWGACTYWARRKDAKRGILDFVTGTLQVEAGPLPEKPVRKALMPLGVVAVALILQVIVFPQIQKLFG